MNTATVPAYFFEDHLNRLNDAASMRKSIAKDHGSKYTVNLTDSQLANLLDDALYYSNASDMGQEHRGLASSARATVRALKGFFE
jgi:hypothetical protein